MYLCPECFLRGFCRNLRTQLVDDAELVCPAFVGDLKAYAHAYAKRQALPWRQWPDHLAGLYSRYPGDILDLAGRAVWLDTEVFDGDAVGYWFRDFCKEVANDVTPRVRREAWERVRVMATILRANDPAGTRLWGIRAANDAEPPRVEPKPYQDAHCAILAQYAVPAALRFGPKQNRRRKAALFDTDLDDDMPF